MRLNAKRGRVFSKDRRVTSGIPQGGVLSPLLWIVYIFDLPAAIAAADVPAEDVHLAIYADDITITIAGPDADTVAARHARVMAAVEKYCAENYLDLNREKSTSMWLQPRERSNIFLRSAPLQTTVIHAGGKSWPQLHQLPLPEPTFPSRNTPLPVTCFPVTSCARILGVHCDDRSTFGQHVQVVKARGRRRAGILRRLASTTWGCRYDVLRTTYLALIQNSIAYAIHAWGSYVADEKWARLNVEVIHPCLRMITGLPRWCRIEALYAASRAMSVQNLYTYKCAKWLDHTLRTTRNVAADTLRALLPLPSDRPPAAAKSRELPATLLRTVPFYGRLGAAVTPDTSLVVSVSTTPPTEPAPSPAPGHSLYTPNAYALKCNHNPFPDCQNWAEAGAAALRNAESPHCASLPYPPAHTTPPRVAALTITQDAPNPLTKLDTQFARAANAGPGTYAAATDGALKDWREGKLEVAAYALASAGRIVEARITTLGWGPSAYDAETVALTAALRRLAAEPQVQHVTLLTDCQSVLRKLQAWRRLNALEAELARALHDLADRHPNAVITLQWSPGHAGVAANEFVDEAITLLWKQGPRVAPQAIPNCPHTHHAATEAVARRMQQDEARCRERLKHECASRSADVLLDLDVTDARIKTWMRPQYLSRPAQAALLRIITNSGFFFRGTQLSCQTCDCPLTAKHVLTECAETKEDLTDTLISLGLDEEPLSLALYASNPELLPTFVQAALPSLRRTLQHSVAARAPPAAPGPEPTAASPTGPRGPPSPQPRPKATTQ